jgi:lysozyme
MTAQERERLRRQLVIHEGLRLKPYRDIGGVLTIGIGRNLEHLGLSEEEAYYLLDNDISRCIRELSGAFSWFSDLDPIRQRVWIDLCFNLGMPRLKGFKKAIAGMEVRDYGTAAAELKDSQWARQVGKRATWLCEALVTGAEPPRL